jgi:hypothetical protein
MTLGFPLCRVFVTGSKLRNSSAWFVDEGTASAYHQAENHALLPGTSDDGQWDALLHRPMPGPRGLGGRVLEAMPGSFNFGLGGPMAPRPCLGGIGRKFGDVKPDNDTGCAVD